MRAAECLSSHSRRTVVTNKHQVDDACNRLQLKGDDRLIFGMHPQRSVVVVAMSPDTAGWMSRERRFCHRVRSWCEAASPLESFLCDIPGQCCIPDAFLNHNPDLQARPIAWRRDPSRAGANAH